MPICRGATLCLLALLSTVLAAQNGSAAVSAAASPQPSSVQDANHGNPQSPTVPMGSTPSQNPSENGGVRPNPAAGASPDSNVNGVTVSSAPQTNPAPAAASDQVLANTEFRAALDTPLSTRTSKPGDRFSATVVDPVRGSGGSIVIPAGSRLEGEIADAGDGAPAALRGRDALSLRFRDVILPSGQTVPLSATLVSVNNTNGRNTKRTDEEYQVRSGAQGKDTAREMETGRGSGASLMFGGPLKGFAIASMAGGGHVITTNGKDVELPAQTGFVIRLSQPIIANGY